MSIFIRAGAACAGLAAAVLMGAAPATAAVVVQTHAFGIDNTVTLHPNEVVRADQLPSADQTDSTPLVFDAFDSSLGALTAVQLTLSATQDFATGVSIVALPGQFHAHVIGSGDYGSDVRLGGLSLDAYDLGATLGEQGCDLYVDLCISQADAHRDEAIDKVFLDKSPFLGAGPVTFDLVSEVKLSSVVDIFFDPPPLITLSTGVAWNGTATLTYLYSTAEGAPGGGGPGSGAPEPSTWILAIMGFGLAGAALRRRQRQRTPA